MALAAHPACGLRKSKLALVQINVGNLCNQSCIHCHVGGSPAGSANMDGKTAQRVIKKLLALEVENIELTGGAPEMNPNTVDFIEALSAAGKKVAVRTNLTVLDLPEYSHLVGLYRARGVKLFASLPSAQKDATDGQRGAGVFEKSIRVLRRLNAAGYGMEGGLLLDIVCNPPGHLLPPADLDRFEAAIRSRLYSDYGISFNGFAAMTNVPLNRFREGLVAAGKLEGYITALRDGFNPATVAGLMCRNLIDVDFEGYIYDCDFNLAAGRRVKGFEDMRFWEIDFTGFAPAITCDEYCWACTASSGSG